MKVFSVLVSSALLSFGCCQAADPDYVYGRDPKKDAEYDIATGMAGIQQAAKDPKLLAQLFQDMQDPELMAEAKKMMESPEWKKKMKDITKDKSFKSNMEKTAKMMEDPDEAAKMQAKYEHMMKVGNEANREDARNTMSEAMQAMNDPKTMAQAAQMMKDPSFQDQMAKMAKDPAFKKYVSAMQEMMQDPATKLKMEQMASAMNTHLEL